MASNTPAIPEGFELEQPATQQTPAIPQGFVLDQAQTLPDGSKFLPNGSGQSLTQGPPEPGFLENIVNQIGNFGRVTANNATLGAADYVTGKLGADNGIGVAGERALTNNAAMDLGHYGNAAAGLTGGALQAAALPAGGPMRAALGAGAMGAAGSALGDYMDPNNTQGVKGIDLGKAAKSAGLAAMGAAAGNGFGFANQQVLGRLQPNIRDQYNLLQNEGVQVSPGQAMSASDGTTRMLNLEARRNNTEGFYPEQLDQFTSAALRHAGIDNNRLVPEQLNTTIRDVGNQMTTLAANNPLNDQGALVGLYRAMRQQVQTWMSNHNGAVNNELSAATSDVMRAAQRGTLTGEQYQDITSRLGEASGGGDAAAGRMRQTVQQAMEAHIGATNPQDLGEWQRLNQQYSNLRVLKNVADNSSRSATSGFVTPSELVTAVRQAQGSASLALGRTDIGDLAQAGQSLIQPHPATTASTRFGEGVGGAAGAGIGHHLGGPAGAFVGKSVGESIGGAIDSALRPHSPLLPLDDYSIMRGANQPQNRVLGNAAALGAVGALNPFTRALVPQNGQGR